MNRPTKRNLPAAFAEPTAAIYLRVSSEDQRERGTVATQREAVERYAELQGIRIFDTYADDGVSGVIPFPNRPESARLLKDAAEGKFDRVLVYRLDRLGRRLSVILDAVSMLDGYGIALRSTTQSFETETAPGRLMLSMLGSFAEFEKDTIVARSIDGTNRCAREGHWLGGIAPYGYRVVGEKAQAGLVVSEEPIAGHSWSEAEVIRFMFRQLAFEGQSCIATARRLTQMGIPPAYVRDGREPVRSKRQGATAGCWWPSRVRNIIVSTTYKGVHEYGKRSNRQRELIAREVPAIVTPEVWERAQAQLVKNQLFSSRNATRQYLLRGLVKCADCGLNYIGTASKMADDSMKPYYVCSGKHGGGRGKYGREGLRCPSKSVHGDELEELIWSDVSRFLRDPQPVLAELAARLDGESGEAERLQGEAQRLENLLAAKAEERARVVTLYRRGMIDDAALDSQLADINGEESALKTDAARLRDGARNAEQTRAALHSAEALLLDLNRRLSGPLTWEAKRSAVETLVEAIQVETRGGEDVPQHRKSAMVRVRYRFAPRFHPEQWNIEQFAGEEAKAPIINCTLTGSWLQQA